MIILINSIGEFIDYILKNLDIKHKHFAQYINISKYDFSKIINGHKKINYDFAMKLSYILKIKAQLWIDIQNKNELILLQKNYNNNYKKYNLQDLLLKTSNNYRMFHF